MTRPLVLIALVSCAVICFGCSAERGQLAELEKKQKAEYAKSLQDRTRSISAELESQSAKLKLAEERANVAEQQKQQVQTQLQQARQDAEDARNQIVDLTAKLKATEERIASAMQALRPSIPDPEPPIEESPRLSGVRLFSWNVESDGSDPEVIATQLKEMDSYDVYALTEVLPDSFETYRNALGDQFESIQTGSGRSDRMQILFNKDKFDLLRRLELNEINFQGRYRSPLVAHLKEKETGIEFLVMVNHLARGKADVRTQQAEQLVEWARDQFLPVVALGDYNFDYEFDTKKGNDGFVAMQKDNIWHWVQPSEMIDSNWYDNPESPDGKDDYPGSLLDFAYVAGSAKNWDLECNIIQRPNDFPDDETTSDHRPYELLIK